MAEKYTGIIEFQDGCVVRIQKVYDDEIADAIREHGPRNLLQNSSKAEEKRIREAVADRLITGWEGLTPLIAEELEYKHWAELPVDSDGFVPYTAATARKLYSGCFEFRDPLEKANKDLQKQAAREKKRQGNSSATLSEPTS